MLQTWLVSLVGLLPQSAGEPALAVGAAAVGVEVIVQAVELIEDVAGAVAAILLIRDEAKDNNDSGNKIFWQDGPPCLMC